MLVPLYNFLPLRVTRAHGIWIETDQGTYLDCYAGIGVMAMGHSYGPTLEALQKKAERHLHLSNYFQDQDALLLARMVLELDGRDGQVLFANSGSEAIEAAIKAVKCLRKGAIVAFRGNFHGRTCGALSLTWSPGLREPFGALLPDVTFLPPEGKALRAFCQEHKVAAVFLEAVQGHGGVVPCSDELASELERLHVEGRFLLVADEIQCGLGRSGRGFGYQLFGLSPDLVALGKALGGGLPLGGLMIFGHAPFSPGSHGSTFAPNPLALAAGVPVLRALRPEFLAEVTRKGQRLMEGLGGLPWVRSVRGRGLMVAACTDDALAVREAAFRRKVLLNVTGDVVRFLPALNISDAELDRMLECLDFSL
ncbi:MAG: aspartate aminotransferase family protein [Dethiosulfovibrio peptidovorans]|nr:MAG: aspartate aminotransferase family protein [Dethiosulfovibrio peptidovorans]